MQPADQLYPHHLGDIHPKALPQCRLCHRQAAAANGQHPQRPGGRRVAVSAQHHLAGPGKALAVQKVTDAVAGLGKIHPESGRRGLEEQVVIRVFSADAQGVVVAVKYAGLSLHPVGTHRQEGLPRHNTGQVMSQGLVHSDGDGGPWRQLTLHQVGAQDLKYNILCHAISAFFLCFLGFI